MILTLKTGVTEKEINEIKNKVKELGYSPEISKGLDKTLVLVKGERAIISRDIFESFEIVESITPISEPYKLVSRKWKKKSIINVGGVKIGSGNIVFMAGPCSVESLENTMEIAETVKAAGATILRGGAFKPRTSPYSFQGLGEEGLKYLRKAADKTGLKVITEAMNIEQLKLVVQYADIVQLGARNMQNFELLKACGYVDKPILLKRGFSNTIKEFLMSAEYIASKGNTDIILCERGIRTFSDYVRFTLDISALPVLKKLTHLPIVVDPSHPAGNRDYVEPLALAAAAAGADGLIIEVHPNPQKASSDGAQTVYPDQFKEIVRKANAIRELLK
ncbi:MAG: 3-deoxy-7-phosphoheptulonate synthase [Elusimicrobia bacterium]|jgi:3-deoxy-7-phosphoheptulonate synthase|nr:3-deoxy-7-phosphoheptulonate synthase [Elusimicrobiota bacterium]